MAYGTVSSPPDSEDITGTEIITISFGSFDGSGVYMGIAAGLPCLNPVSCSTNGDIESVSAESTAEGAIEEVVEAW